MWGTFFWRGLPIIRIIAYWGLCWVLLFEEATKCAQGYSKEFCFAQWLCCPPTSHAWDSLVQLSRSLRRGVGCGRAGVSGCRSRMGWEHYTCRILVCIFGGAGAGSLLLDQPHR